MIYAYTTTEDHVEEVDAVAAIKSFAKSANLTIDKLVEDPDSNRTRWEKRELLILIDNMQPGDTLVAYEAANLACSTLQLLEILEALTEKNAVLKLIKHDESFSPEEMADTQEFLSMVQNIESGFVAHRTTDALAKRRAAGLPLGRPKGRKNKSRKLDKHRAEIKKYLALNISKASIAKLIGCHPQTLYNYLDEVDLDEDISEE